MSGVSGPVRACGRRPILVVDDEAGIRESFDVLLGDTYDVRYATDVREALRLLETERPGLIFLDVRLGEQNGLELLRRLRQHGDPVRVVMVTAVSDERVEWASRVLGADAFLSKPFDIADVERLARAAAT